MSCSSVRLGSGFTKTRTFKTPRPAATLGDGTGSGGAAADAGPTTGAPDGPDEDQVPAQAPGADAPAEAGGADAPTTELAGTHGTGADATVYVAAQAVPPVVMGVPVPSVAPAVDCA